MAFDRKAYYEATKEKQRATAKAWRANHPEQYKEQLSRQRVRKRTTDPIGVLLNSAKRRAKLKGIDFSITKSDLLLPDTCPVLGIPLVYDAVGIHVDGSASIDRIDSTLGYVPGNVVIISWRANRIKCDATIDELKLIVEYYSSL